MREPITEAWLAAHIMGWPEWRAWAQSDPHTAGPWPKFSVEEGGEITEWFCEPGREAYGPRHRRWQPRTCVQDALRLWRRMPDQKQVSWYTTAIGHRRCVARVRQYPPAERAAEDMAGALFGAVQAYVRAQKPWRGNEDA